MTEPRESISSAVEIAEQVDCTQLPRPALKAYVISLANSPRRISVAGALQRTGLDWSFFDALTGDAGCGFAYSEQAAVRSWGRPLTESEIGCAASHIAVMRLISHQQAGWGLVLEDDVLIDPFFDFSQLPELCDTAGLPYLRLYAKAMAKPQPVTWVGQRQLVRFERSPMGTQAYLVSCGGASGFLRSIKNISRPADWELDRFWHNRLANYALFPFPILETAAATSVEKRGVESYRRTSAEALTRFAFRAREYVLRAFANRRLRTLDRRVQSRLSGTAFSFGRR